MTESIALGVGLQDPQTITYNEESKGWVSFKDYHPTHGTSVASKYFTFKDAKLYEHYHDLASINMWYSGIIGESRLSFYVNADPSTIKNFEYVSYEGSQTFVPASSNEAGKLGWRMKSIETELELGEAYNHHEFKKKEGKWFNYIKRVSTSQTELNTSNVQGLGVVLSSQQEADE